MALVTAQLLFVEHLDPGSVRLDVIVLARVEAGASPCVGAPLSFPFRLPADAEARGRVCIVLDSWSQRGATIDIDLRARAGSCEIVLRSGVAGVVLHPWVPQGTSGCP